VKIGLGLPICDSRTLMTWARRIDSGPFSSIGFLDRLVYHNPEALITLAGAAAVTNRARILTEVLIAPLRNTAVLAKECATLDQLSGGRLTLGLGAGVRADDFAAAGVAMSGRGRTLDGQLTTLRRLWAGEPFSAEAGPIGPPPVQPGGPEILIGGSARAALERVARHADGFLCAAAPAATGALFRSVEHFWAAAGRTGSPRLVAQLNVALGTPEQIDSSRAAMQRYYAFLPDPAAHAAEMLGSAGAIREAIMTFSDIGADEVMLYCWLDRVDQIDRFADLAAQLRADMRHPRTARLIGFPALEAAFRVLYPEAE
jgi:alkanesulfonate monooxygenase SsuD/methylene tetrahydromethanopterin reductase-like flavin-dependent oxidoreductase (luciferase family)